ncbi:hypothetical protein CBER1_03871 [Cercospora berteroae]|uniref:F-box domain-containing protein n=1 Tax=Cercospora berteroae TaxID=357750 RepID=A0A2S6CE65_9PEZI|nr:hypothetical protein CBER1_03871 [Cercospora berteroae]
MALTDMKRAETEQSEVEENQMGESPFRFLDLPPELQLNIIEYAVTPGPATPNRTQPAITHANRSIRVDSLEMYDKNNSFVGIFCSAGSNQNGALVVKWLKAIGEDNRRYVHDLTVFDDECLDDWDNCSWDEEIDECLQDFKVEVESMQGRVGNAMWRYE